jgi:hypothetical protein
VLSRAEMDVMLKGKWDGMKAALAQGDIEAAVKDFDEYSREEYRETFLAISEILPEVLQGLSDIQFIQLNHNVAEYDIRTIRNGKEYSFYLMFVRGYDGIWRIRSF